MLAYKKHNSIMFYIYGLFTGVYTRIDVKHTYIFAKQHSNKILLCIIVASVTNSKSNFDSKYAVYISYNYVHLLFAGVRITYIAKSNTKKCP